MYRWCTVLYRWCTVLYRWCTVLYRWCTVLYTVQVVYCDMNKLPGSPGFERLYGSPGNLRDFVAFDAFVTEDITDNYRYIGTK